MMQLVFKQRCYLFTGSACCLTQDARLGSYWSVQQQHHANVCLIVCQHGFGPGILCSQRMSDACATRGRSSTMPTARQNTVVYNVVEQGLRGSV